MTLPLVGKRKRDEQAVFLRASLSWAPLDGAAVADHGYPDLTPTPPNIIGGTNANGTLNYAVPISASFFTTANPSILATTNSVSVLGDLFGLGSGSVTLSAFDYLGNFLGSVTDTDNKPLGSGPILTLNLAGIHSVTFSSTSGTVGFDNFQFGELTEASVPGPHRRRWLAGYRDGSGWTDCLAASTGGSSCVDFDALIGLERSPSGGLLFVVPELTRSADIQLNKRV